MAFVENGNAETRFLCSSTKKNVFLIGDSIRQGYCAGVKETLADRANVFYVEDNCRSTQYVIFNLNIWRNMFSDPALVDVVHFNCGHWDIAHWLGGTLPLTSTQEYGRNIQIIIDMLKVLFPNAKLIFATTTTMNPSGEVGINPRTNAEIASYNQIATAVAQENRIPVNDLFAITAAWDSGVYRDYCHLTPEANRVLSKTVADFISSQF